MSTTTRARIGGDVVVESLEALGARVAFGVPGVHALAIWEAARSAGLHIVGTRTELCAGFAADGYARSSRRPAPLLLSTGPGALNSLTAIMEAASAHVPVLAISSQIPSSLLGRGRGYLHELPDQRASFAPIVKYVARASRIEEIPAVLAGAWRVSLMPPSGPAYVEIPVDLLTGDAAGFDVDAELARPLVLAAAPPDACAEAAQLLAGARSPVIWAGGGVRRSGGEAALVALAERLSAPVATTYMGKGAIGDEHPLALGCGCDEAAFQEVLSRADVVLCVGTELGAETTGQYALRFGGQLVQIDADEQRIGATYPALGLVGDARATLEELLRLVPAGPDIGAQDLVRRVRARIAEGLAAQGRSLELGLLRSIEDALSPDAIGSFDMTILAYWAAPHLRIGSAQQFLYPLGSGTLGYAWPAAIGASIAHPDRQVLAVAGDGGIQYALAELATAAQYGVGAKLLIVDDGGYGILREYQAAAYGATGFVDLREPDFVGLAQAFGVPARSGDPGELRELLEWAFSVEGPAVAVVQAKLVAAAPTA